VWNLNKAEWNSENQQRIKGLRIDKLERKLKDAGSRIKMKLNFMVMQRIAVKFKTK